MGQIICGHGRRETTRFAFLFFFLPKIFDKLLDVDRVQARVIYRFG